MDVLLRLTDIDFNKGWIGNKVVLAFTAVCG